MKKTVIAIVMALILCLSCFIGLRTEGEPATLPLTTVGTLVLRVNPEIAVEYDEDGKVTAIIARNNDAIAIIDSCTGLIGQSAKDVVTKLVDAIGQAGYFVEEVEGQQRQITLEIEPGSALPSGTFLEEIVEAVKKLVNNHDWSAPLDVQNQIDLDITDYLERPTDATVPSGTQTPYNDTDYGPNNDGVTDYQDTPYDDTDYGPNNDGVTDYQDTPYDDTDYGPNNDDVTDYQDTPYDNTSPYEAETPYDQDSDYGRR